MVPVNGNFPAATDKCKEKLVKTVQLLRGLLYNLFPRRNWWFKMNKILANFNCHQYRYLAAAVVMAGAATFMIPGPPPRISKANFDKIKIGMPQIEVEEILGPGADRSSYTNRIFYGHMYIGPQGRCPSFHDMFWDGDDGTIQLTFTYGTVRHKQWCEDVPMRDQIRHMVDEVREALRW